MCYFFFIFWLVFVTLDNNLLRFISVLEFISSCYLFYYVLKNVPHYDLEDTIFSYFPIFASYFVTFCHVLFLKELLINLVPLIFFGNLCIDSYFTYLMLLLKIFYKYLKEFVTFFIFLSCKFLLNFEIFYNHFYFLLLLLLFETSCYFQFFYISSLDIFLIFYYFNI